MNRSLFFCTIALISFSTLLFELVQTRVLSFVFWNNVVYLAVSVALLGFGISGTLCCVFRHRIPQRRATISRALSAFAITSVFAILITAIVPLTAIPSFAKLGLCYLSFVWPFTCSGVVISMILSAKKYSVGKLYAADLIAGSVACAIAFVLLQSMGPVALTSLLGLIVSVAAFIWTKATDRVSRNAAVAAFGLSGAFLAGAYMVPELFFHFPDHEKLLFKALMVPGAQLEYSAWSPLCKIDVVGFKNQPDKLLTQDADAFTAICSKAENDSVTKVIKQNFLKSPPINSAYWLKVNDSPDVAVVGVGGGRDVAAALRFGAKSVAGAEFNPVTYRLVTDSVFADYSGHMLNDPRVHIYNEEGRAMIRQLDHQLDIIQVSGVDTFAAASAGAYMLSESYLYTTEALEAMMGKLKPKGILAFNRITAKPPTEPIRLVAMACETYRKKGVKDFDKNIVVLTESDRQTPDGSYVQTMFKDGPFEKSELETLIKGAALNPECAILYVPKILPAGEIEAIIQKQRQDRPHMVPEAPLYEGLVASYMSGTEKKFMDEYPKRIDTPHDDSPFFFDFVRNVFSFDANVNSRGAHALIIVLIESVILSAVAILLPLFVYQREGLRVPHVGNFALYFASIGMGYMLIEICLVQKTILFLGSPVYSLSAVLATLLLSAGLGSYVQSLLRANATKVAGVFAAGLVLVLGILIFGFNALVYSCMHLPLAMRIAITVAVLFPPGLLMGTFFPHGISALRGISSAFVPWAWGINGCMSVFGSFAAIVLSIYFGFTVALAVGTAIYVMAALAALRFPKSQTT